MVQHVWKKLDSIPLVFAVVSAIGVFVPCIIALSNKHVSPYMPNISEGGGMFPEAGIFSICISLSAYLCQWIIVLHYLVVEQLNISKGISTTNLVNKIALAFGSFSSLCLIIVASCPTSSISQVHHPAAFMGFLCNFVYLIFQTVISFKVLGHTKMAYFRLVIILICGISFVFCSTFGLIGKSMWSADYWAGKKQPGDKGFAYFVIGSCFEWIIVFVVVLFFTTYIFEFKKSTLNFEMELTTGKKFNSF